MLLTDREKELIKQMIDRGEPLPPKYKLALFADTPEVELIWQGKTSEVTNAVLPFQIIEQIDEPRSEKSGQIADLFTYDLSSGRQSGGWSNKLIWGDNKLVLSSLKNGPLRREIEAAGGLKLVYIDPPFDMDADFSVTMEVGEEVLTKQPTVIEEVAYRDTWGRGGDSYIAMIYERLRLIHELLHPDGAIFVHVGPTVSHRVRCALDEIFGSDRFVNEIIWRRAFAHNDPNRCGTIHDTILYYSKSDRRTWNKVFQKPNRDYIEQFFDQYDEQKKEWYNRIPLDAPKHGDGGSLVYEWRGVYPAKSRTWAVTKERMEEYDRAGRIHYPKSGVPRLKRYESEYPGSAIQDLWCDINKIHNQSPELLNYDTQKPEGLIARIISAASNEGDLVADFFCGSGTTLAVAEKLNRKWIGSDLGRFAIHTSRKRLISVQRELKASNKPYRSLEILNLGKYERQYFVGINPNLPEEERRQLAIQREEQYLSLILQAYKGERVLQFSPFHGKKGGTAVFVGPIDAPVTISVVQELIQACKKLKLTKVDVLGFEFEMGLIEMYQDEANLHGVKLAIRYIPKDVFDKRAVEKKQVKFFDAAFMRVVPKVKKNVATVTLESFGVFYTQDDIEVVSESLKPGNSRVTIENGQVIKVSKDKKGIVSRDSLTRKWTDWIDYWAVDFDYESRREIIKQIDETGKEVDVWTGGYIFENQWQSFRSKKDRSIELTSAEFEYASKGKFKIAVKVIDIFGNDTTKVVEVKI
jgi:adenine-specific DNA-methyltransferase